MYDNTIKEWLLENRSKVYSLISKTYHQEINDFGSTLFRNWLSKKLDISEEKINLSSLNSALTRNREKIKSKISSAHMKNQVSNSTNDFKHERDFTFSKVDELPKKSRFEEL